jgi:hypothetical protein
MLDKKIWMGVGAVALLGAAVFGLKALEGRPSAAPAKSGQIDLPSDPNAAFAAHECAIRLQDERPALAVVFTQPLDASTELNKFIRVTDLGPVQGQDGAAEEGPVTKPPAMLASAPRDGGRIVQGSWTVGENPRIAYFAAIQPQRRYRIDVDAALKSIDAQALAAAKQ